MAKSRMEWLLQDLSKPQKQEWTLAPEGTYVAQIVEAGDYRSKNSGKTTFRVVYQVRLEDGRTAKVCHYFSIYHEKCSGWAKSDLRKLASMAGLQEGKPMEELVGLHVCITVVHEDVDGKTYAHVVKVKEGNLVRKDQG